MTATDSEAAPGPPSGIDLPEGLITPEALDDLRRILLGRPREEPERLTAEQVLY